MEKKHLIVGHGLAGCVLALTFYRQGIPFHIVGYTQPGEASMMSSGLINPVTGRRYVKAWMIDELIEKSLDFYKWSEELFGEKYFFPVDIIRFLSNHEAIAAWKKRSDDPDYVDYISMKRMEQIEKLQRPYGIVTGGYRLNAPGWLTATRNFLVEKGFLSILNEPMRKAVVENGSVIHANGALDSSISKGLIPNKGEVLIVKMPGWAMPGIIKEKVYFIPLEERNMYWIGSHYLPWPDHARPTEEGKQMILDEISEVYSGEVEIIEHLAGYRPTVDDRRPLIGPYPGHDGEYIFNGMGTKGTSLAPYWAEQLVAHLEDDACLPFLVQPARYNKASG
ncbi:MAG: FAD-dependent oxidoreductase [Saprospiraceae bacterium]